MADIVGRQTTEFLVVLNQLIDFFTEQVNMLFITDNFDFVATGYQFQFRETLSDNFKIAVVDTKKFHRIKGVNRDDDFTQGETYYSFFDRMGYPQGLCERTKVSRSILLQNYLLLTETRR